MFNIKITSINVPDGQKGLYYYEIIIKYDNAMMNMNYHTSFTPAQDTVEDAVRIATNYNTRDGLFQENMLKHALTNGTVTHEYIDDKQTKYKDIYNILTVIN